MMFRQRFAYLLVALMMLLAACAGPMNGLPGDGTLDATVPAEAVLQAQQYLAEQLGVSIGEIQIVETERVEWPDACLGLPDQDEACASVVTPGWRVTFEVNGETYELRTDEAGSVIRAVGDLQS